MQHEIREKKVLQCIPYFLNWRLGNVVQDRSLLDSMVVVLLECLKRIVLSKSFYLHVSTSKLVTSLYRCLVSIFYIDSLGVNVTLARNYTRNVSAIPSKLYFV